MATDNKCRQRVEVKKHNSRQGRTCLPCWMLVACVGICTGCWSEPEAPAPLPVPIADPQIVPRAVPPLAASDFAAVRRFRFFYDVTVTGLKPGEQARIWLPLATDGAQQRVKREQTNLPGNPQETTEAKYGNPLLYTEAAANDEGEIPLLVTYLVERVEALPEAGETVSESALSNSLDESLVWTGHDPQLSGLMQRSKAAAQLPASQQARANYDKLLGVERMKSSDSLSLLTPFVILCRRNKIPADAEWGFLIAKEEKGKVPQTAGWAKYVTEGRWQMVDLATAQSNPDWANYAFGSLSPDRIHFTTGYNLKLQPAPMEVKEVPMLVLPYVEVAGKRYEKLKTNFHYVEVEESIE